MSARALAATAMAFRDQGRRPLVVILLVIVPAYVITRSIAETLVGPTAPDTGNEPPSCPVVRPKRLIPVG